MDHAGKANDSRTLDKLHDIVGMPLDSESALLWVMRLINKCHTFDRFVNDIVDTFPIDGENFYHVIQEAKAFLKSGVCKEINHGRKTRRI